MFSIFYVIKFEKNHVITNPLTYLSVVRMFFFNLRIRDMEQKPPLSRPLVCRVFNLVRRKVNSDWKQVIFTDFDVNFKKFD